MSVVAEAEFSGLDWTAFRADFLHASIHKLAGRHLAFCRMIQ